MFKPNLTTYNNLLQHSCEKGSFDGADQGLLNSYFCDWFMKPENRLSFLYNAAFSTAYFYMSAFRKFEKDIKILHFLGKTKPWHLQFDAINKKLINVPETYGHVINYLDYWWRLCLQKPIGVKEHEMGGNGAAAGSSAGTATVKNVEPAYETWHSGQMDYMGVDSFSNIAAHLEKSIDKNSKK